MKTLKKIIIGIVAIIIFILVKNHNFTDVYPKIATNNSPLVESTIYEVNNRNFLSKVKSNTTLILTEDIVIPDGFEIREKTNISIKGKNGKFKISGSGNYLCHIISSSNITFENIIFESTRTSDIGWGAVTAQQEAADIKFIDCDFVTAKSNGFSGWCVLDTGAITDVNFERCTFNTGRMGIEFVNHLEDKVRRYKNVTIKDCLFKTFGTVEYPMGISFSGYGEECFVSNNTFYSSNTSAIGIELVGCSDSKFDGNKFEGSFVYFSASNSRKMNNLSITNNKMLDDYSEVGTYINNVSNSVISGNTLGYTRIVKCNNLKVTNNNFISSNVTALILDNSHDNVLEGNYYSTYNSSKTSAVLSFYGLKSYNNGSYNDTFIRSSDESGNYIDNTGGADNNQVEKEIIDSSDSSINR